MEIADPLVDVEQSLWQRKKLRILILLIIGIILVVGVIIVIILITRENYDDPQKDNTGVMYNLESIMEMKYIFRYSINDLISILILIVSAFFCIPVFYVFFIQIKGIFIK